MKIKKTANGKAKLVITKSEWQQYGRQAGWLDQEVTEESTPCAVCGETTQMTGTELCDKCWMVEGYLENPVSGSDKEHQYRMAPQDIRLKAWRHLKEKGVDVAHINMNDSGPGFDLSRNAQVDQTQPLDGVQTSKAAEGGSATPNKLKCAKKGCNNEFTVDPVNPNENCCEKCRG